MYRSLSGSVIEECHMAANPQTKVIILDYEFTCRLLSPARSAPTTTTIQYYSARKLMLILPSRLYITLTVAFTINTLLLTVGFNLSISCHSRACYPLPLQHYTFDTYWPILLLVACISPSDVDSHNSCTAILVSAIVIDFGQHSLSVHCAETAADLAL